MNKTQDLKLQITMDLEREREKESWVFGHRFRERERELGFRPRLREREGRVFGLRELGFGQGLERERESWDFGHGFRERERERERDHLQRKSPLVTSDPPSSKTTNNHLHRHLERALEIFIERKRAWRLEIDKLEILISILFTERDLGACRKTFLFILFFSI